MNRTARRLILAFAMLGLGASAASAYIHYRILRDPGYASVCDINAAWNCTQVYTSRFGSMGGVPVAILGVLFFTVVMLLAAPPARRSKPFQENVPGYLFALSTLALASVIYLAYASFVVLKTACIFCVLTYVAVIGIFLVTGAATAFPMTSLPGRAWRDIRTLGRSPAALAVVLLFLAGAAALVALFPRQGPVEPVQAAAAAAPLTDDDRSEFERWYDQLPRVDVPVPTDGAAVRIVKFNDYQCPPCRKTYFEYTKVLEKYRDRPVKFVTRDFPLDPECNPAVKQRLHDAACEAAVAVRLARPLGTAERLEEWLFTNQETLTPGSVRQAAATVAQVKNLDQEYAKTLEAVKADIALGGRLGVGSTPTFFINNVALPPGGLPPEYFDAAVAYELRKAGK